jgi:hypothetical protein
MHDQYNSIEKTMQAINLMYENIGDEMSVSQLEEIRDRHETLIKQSSFWLEQDNQERYLYDLKDFATWLFKYLQWDKNDEH